MVFVVGKRVCQVHGCCSRCYGEDERGKGIRSNVGLPIRSSVDSVECVVKEAEVGRGHSLGDFIPMPKVESLDT